MAGDPGDGDPLSVPGAGDAFGLDLLGEARTTEGEPKSRIDGEVSLPVRVGEGEAKTIFDGDLDGLLRAGRGDGDTTAPDAREGVAIAGEGEERGIDATQLASAERRADTPGNASGEGEPTVGLLRAGAGIAEILSTGPSSAATSSTAFLAFWSSV